MRGQGEEQDLDYYSATEFYTDVAELASKIKQSNRKIDFIYGVPKNGVIVALGLQKYLNIPITDELTSVPIARTLIVDDITDTGKTLYKFQKQGFPIAVLHKSSKTCIEPNWYIKETDDWIVYWWEGTEEKSIEDSVIRQLQFIGEDPTREGLLDTPKRVIKSWSHLFSGYNKEPEKLFVSFEEKYDEIVLLKNIEFYSTCEHHLLPFFGKAHIAYIPNGKVIGVSKLARLLEIYSRRLQIQERIGEQVVKSIDKYLNAKGSACILEAQHFCMTSRGVEKQNSVMVTSSLSGCFLEKNNNSKIELMQLIRGV